MPHCPHRLALRWAGPDADRVTRGVTDDGDAQGALGVGLDHLGPLRRRALQGRPKVLDVHVRPDPRLPGRFQVGPPVADDVAGPLAEAGYVRVAAQLPAEHGL